MADYPRWAFYPSRDEPPEWVNEFVGVVATAKPTIDSAQVSGLTSDKVLARLCPGLEGLGFQVETGKKANEKITLPVLYGGRASRAFATTSTVSTGS